MTSLKLASYKGAMSVKKSAVVCALVVFSLLAAACGSDEDSSSALKVGYAADLSDLGGFADMATGAFEGMDLGGMDLGGMEF